MSAKVAKVLLVVVPYALKGGGGCRVLEKEYEVLCYLKQQVSTGCGCHGDEGG